MRREVIQLLGNWKDPRMVARYTGFSDEVQREAAAQVATIVGGRKKRREGVETEKDAEVYA